MANIEKVLLFSNIRFFFSSARAFFGTATSLGPNLYEPAFNMGFLAERVGDLQTSFVVIQKALKNFPDHRDSEDLLLQLKKHFSVL